MPEEQPEEKHLRDVKNFIFDLDHTVWYWNKLVPGARETIQKLKAQDKDIFYVSNNSLLTREGVADKLTDLGIKTHPDHVITSAYVAAKVLSKKGINNAYVIGEQGLIEELEKEHIKTSKAAHNIVIGYDRNFSFWKMAKAAELARNGAKMWLLGSGNTFRAGDRILPGDKPLWASVKIASGTDNIERLCKPSKDMIKLVKDEFPVFPGRTAFIGDSLESDIVMGNRMGCKTGLVLTGDTERADLNDVAGLQIPDFVFTRFDRILRKV